MLPKAVIFAPRQSGESTPFGTGTVPGYLGRHFVRWRGGRNHPEAVETVGVVDVDAAADVSKCIVEVDAVVGCEGSLLSPEADDVKCTSPTPAAAVDGDDEADALPAPTK